jgi:hypothetical protein
MMHLPRHDMARVIEDFLRDGPKTAMEVYAHLAEHGYSRSGTVGRAAKEAGVVIRRLNTGVGSHASNTEWKLP